MSAHTPGPWARDGALWLFGSGDKLVCAFDSESPPSAEDARLIAAAPELLAALKQARLMIDPFVHDTSDIDAIIAKADGRE